MTKTFEIEKVYKLTPMQEGMLYHTLLNKENPYFGQTTFTIQGNLDSNIFGDSLNMLMHRYDVFRTVFIYEEVEEPVQVVLKERKADLRYEDISELSEEAQVVYCKEIQNKDQVRNFDLSRDVLSRVYLIKRSENKYQIIWSMHHIIMDGWCMGVLIKELFQIYNSIERNLLLDLKESPPYQNYISWLEMQDEEEALSYWGKYLNGYNNAATLMNLQKKDKTKIPCHDSYTFVIQEQMSVQLAKLAQNQRVTLNVLLQAIWGILLQRYNNADDVVFGSVVSGRSPEVEGIETMMGLFINTVPTRITGGSHKTFSQLLHEIQQDMLLAKKYEYCDLTKIQARTDQKQSLFNHIFAFENYPLEEEMFHSDLVLSDVESFEQTNYDFNVMVIPGRELMIKIVYDAGSYDQHLVRLIEGHFKQVIKTVLLDPKIAVSSITILTEEEIDRILYTFNNRSSQYSVGSTINSLFSQQVIETPDNIALIYKDNKLTYKELNRKADMLAVRLRKNGIKPNDIVAIMADNSPELVWGLLGVLKAGGAYLPIDPTYPDERIEYMLADSKSETLLVQKSLINKVRFTGKIIDLNEVMCQENSVDLEQVNKPDDLAYVIYTSGSTGNPKGVMIEHRALMNLVEWHKRYYQISEQDRCTKYAGVAFDASVWEIFPCLLSGAALHIIDDALRLDLGKLNEYYEKNQITVSFLPTPICEQFMEYDNQSLRKLLTGGDKLKRYIPRNYDLINNYGPTENTVVTTCFAVTESWENIPIGKPITNVKVYIIDRNDCLQPLGCPGELCIAGAGLARGYLDRPDITSLKFVDNPFAKNEKMYKTGDLARWLSDGNIEFLGRIDSQVKVRGFRVETGEVESRLLEDNNIKAAAVLVKDDSNGNAQLYAYIVAATEPDIEIIKVQLAKKLPNYMIPARFIQIDQMPLTPNGKIDRKKLKSFHVNSVKDEPKETVLINETEKQLLQIWKRVLDRDDVKLDSNFFDVGGNSILLVQAYSQIAGIFPGELTLTDIFANPSIAKLAAFINRNKERLNFDTNLIPVLFPKEYFSYDDCVKENTLCEVMISHELLNKLKIISNNEELNLYNLLLAMYIFLLYQVTEQENISIQTKTNKTEQVRQLSVNFATVKDFPNLFSLIKQNSLNGGSGFAYDLVDILGRYESKKGYHIMPLFCTKNAVGYAGNILSDYSLILKVDEKSDRVIITSEQDGSCLKAGTAKELLYAYINLIDRFVSEYKAG